MPVFEKVPVKFDYICEAVDPATGKKCENESAYMYVHERLQHQHYRCACHQFTRDGCGRLNTTEYAWGGQMWAKSNV